MNVYKINDIISCDFLKIPKAMFANERYRELSSDAKLTYALLYDRLSLSKLNGWINENDEVYLIYTREEIAEDLGISYKKAISAFKELLTAGLIAEKRCGRGVPNKIYIVKAELSANSAKKYVRQESIRTSDSAHQDKGDGFENFRNGTSETPQDMPKMDVLNFQSRTSRTVETAHSELPDRHPNNTDNNKTYKNYTYSSQSVGQSEQYNLEDIIANCQLDSFNEEERKILYDAIERLFYTDNFRICGAVLPQVKVRSRLYELDASVLQSALQRLHSNRDRPVKNLTRYVMSTIFNSITEDYSLAHIDPYLNSLREPQRGCAACS